MDYAAFQHPRPAVQEEAGCQPVANPPQDAILPHSNRNTLTKRTVHPLHFFPHLQIAFGGAEEHGEIRILQIPEILQHVGKQAVVRQAIHVEVVSSF